MPQLLYTIDEYIATKRKKPTIWIVFNSLYNDVHAFKKKLTDEESLRGYLDEKYTDTQAREEFLDFMKTNFPDVALLKVFDLVSLGYLVYPYLGSIAIDTDVGSDAYVALSQKYGDPYGDATVNNKVLWVMEYDDAKSMYDKKQKLLEDEFE